MKVLVGGPLLVGGLGPAPPGPPLNPALACKLKIPNSMDSVLVYIENVMIHKCDEPFSPSLWLI